MPLVLGPAPFVEDLERPSGVVITYVLQSARSWVKGSFPEDELVITVLMQFSVPTIGDVRDLSLSLIHI